MKISTRFRRKAEFFILVKYAHISLLLIRGLITFAKLRTATLFRTSWANSLCATRPTQAPVYRRIYGTGGQRHVSIVIVKKNFRILELLPPPLKETNSELHLRSGLPGKDHSNQTISPTTKRKCSHFAILTYKSRPLANTGRQSLER